MKITIMIGDELPEAAKVDLLVMLWAQAQTGTGGDFTARHDGDPALSQLANAKFDRYAAVRWQ